MKKQVLNIITVVAVVAAMTQTVSAQRIIPTPDTASTSALLGVVCVALGAARRFVRR